MCELARNWTTHRVMLSTTAGIQPSNSAFVRWPWYTGSSIVCNKADIARFGDLFCFRGSVVYCLRYQSPIHIQTWRPRMDSHGSVLLSCAKACMSGGGPNYPCTRQKAPRGTPHCYVFKSMNLPLGNTPHLHETPQIKNSPARWCPPTWFFAYM